MMRMMMISKTESSLKLLNLLHLWRGRDDGEYIRLCNTTDDGDGGGGYESKK